MKLYYITNIRLPTEKAHGIQIMKVCEAFAASGVEVELVVSDRSTSITEDPFSYYGVKKIFSITQLRGIDLVGWGKIGFIIQSITFALSARWYMHKRAGVVYTREADVAYLLLKKGRKVIWETHNGQKNYFVRGLISAQTPIVAISRGLMDFYLKIGVRDDRILVAPDAVEIGMFDISLTRDEARKRLSLDNFKTIVIYTGHLYEWKGVYTLAEAAKLLPAHIEVVFIGGTEQDIVSFKKRYGDVHNISVFGKKPHKEMPLYLKAADLLVLPNSGKEDISRFYTSPLKLFEYMASGTPIIASDLPSLKEITDLSTVYFFQPDDASGLASTIRGVLLDQEAAHGKAVLAREVVKNYAWENRIEDILRFIQ